jgi:hypothetical protein
MTEHRCLEGTCPLCVDATPSSSRGLVVLGVLVALAILSFVIW